MVDPINLNKARKARAASEARTRAAENRVRFVRSKAEKDTARAQAEKLARALDQTKRED